MSWKHLSFTDAIRVMQAVADVAPDKASKVAFALGKGSRARSRARSRAKKHTAAEREPEVGEAFVNPGPTIDEVKVLEEVMDAIRGKLIDRWGQEYVDDLAERVRRR